MFLVSFHLPFKMKASQRNFKYVYLIGFAIQLLGFAAAFSVVPSPVRSFRVESLRVVADPHMKDDTQKNGGNNSDEEAWISGGNGGFFPNLRAFFGRRVDVRQQTDESAYIGESTGASPSDAFKASKVVQVVDIHQYKSEVVDVEHQVVCVRFYAPWCKSCKAMEAAFRRLPHAFAGYPVKFVECPVTKDNAYLHKGLGIPSLPFGHIYHPEAGLVEERKINKHVFEDFQKVLWTYAQGECHVSIGDDGSCIPL